MHFTGCEKVRSQGPKKERLSAEAFFRCLEYLRYSLLSLEGVLVEELELFSAEALLGFDSPSPDFSFPVLRLAPDGERWSVA